MEDKVYKSKQCDSAYLWSTAEDVAASLSVDKLCWLDAFELSVEQTKPEHTVNQKNHFI